MPPYQLRVKLKNRDNQNAADGKSQTRERVRKYRENLKKHPEKLEEYRQKERLAQSERRKKLREKK